MSTPYQVRVWNYRTGRTELLEETCEWERVRELVNDGRRNGKITLAYNAAGVCLHVPRESEE